MKRVLKILVGLVILFGVIQLVPYGRDHTNPPSTGEPAWDSPRTRELVVRACFDCHSNHTVWPWYSHVAPVSWFLQHHIDEGRERLNFSQWDPKAPQKAARHADREVTRGDMPLTSYTWMHPEARLTDAEKTELAKGLRATFGSDAGGDRQ